MTKRNIFLALMVIILLSAFTSAVSSLTQRSTQQVVITGENITAVKNQINIFYKYGYRVTSVTCQSVSIGSGTCGSGCSLSGNFLIIMEK